LAAQWVDFKTPGIPRTPDGKPDLSAPVPRTADGKPDLSGIWRAPGNSPYARNIAVDLKPGEILPWAQALYQQHVLDLGADSPRALLARPSAVLSLGGHVVREFLLMRSKKQGLLRNNWLLVDLGGPTHRDAGGLWRIRPPSLPLHRPYRDDQGLCVWARRGISSKTTGRNKRSPSDSAFGPDSNGQ